ncbi:hypothetical protein IQ07DRAFT_592320 [Pyrenochaeta sp. DS3sAY3a]|nr:hypothetical protein IQ07DRAFT_592320 [Pyrenochaeta sp. DS3sAY3a]
METDNLLNANSDRTRQCTKCLKVLSTVNHLRRHEATHNNPVHPCIFCDRIFTRHDALRRHSKTCSHRGERREIARAKQGRKRRSCDGCYSRKLRCDGLSPCSQCISSRIECIVSLVNFNVSSIAKERSGFVHEESASLENDLHKVHLPLSFLRSYTDTSHECITDALVAKGVLAEVNADQSQNPAMDHDELNKVFAEDIEDLFPDMFTTLCPDQVKNHISLKQPTAIYSSATKIRLRLKELISQILGLDAPPFDFGYPQDTREAHHAAIQLFTPDNLTRFLHAYFTYAHPHFPFIHRPTFDAFDVTLPLLLAVFLGGSIHCYPQDDALRARSFFDLGERYIFGILSQQTDKSECGLDEQVQLLQAALLMYCLQMNFNSVQIRRRIRTLRFPDLVAYGRALGVLAARSSAPEVVPEWTYFIAQETSIRLGTYLFLADAMSTLFFNSVPQITLSEMVADLPCPTAIFEAPTRKEFQKTFSQSPVVKTKPLSLLNIMELLLHDGELSAQTPSAPIEPGHMIITIFALHALVYNARTSIASSATYEALVQATNRWKVLWDELSTPTNQARSQPFGFEKYALELFWLAQKILEVTSLDYCRSGFLSAAPTYSLADLHMFIRLHAAVDN